MIVVQSLAMGDDSELRQRDLVHEDNGADALQQQELERPVHVSISSLL